MRHRLFARAVRHRPRLARRGGPHGQPFGQRGPTPASGVELVSTRAISSDRPSVPGRARSGR
jgi:hypothetical protein